MDTMLATVTRAHVPMAHDPENGPRRLLKAFLERRSEHTQRAYKADLGDFANWAGTPGTAEAIAALIGQGAGPANETGMAYKASLIRAGLAAATVNRRLSTLRSVLKMARTVGLANFTLEVESEQAQAYRDTRGPGEEKVRELVAKLTTRAAQGHRQSVRDLAIVRLLFNLGLRRGEVVGLDVEHFDREQQRLSIKGKCRSEREWLDLSHSPAVRAALEAWLVERGDDPGPMFFRCDRLAKTRQDRAGVKRLTATSVWRMLKKFGIRPHGLRHTAITAVAKLSGGDIFKVMAFSRHKNANVVTRYVDNLEANAAKMAGMLESVA